MAYQFDILSCAPPNIKLRDVQKRALLWVQDNWEKLDVMTINMPVGSGKSIVAMAVCEWTKRNGLGGSATITPTKILQDQYTNDFTWVPMLKGMDSYNCAATPAGNCKATKRIFKKCCGPMCPYIVVRTACQVAPVSIYNFHSYYHNKMHKRNVVIDECFPSEQRIETENGSRTIGDIYKKNKKGEHISVWSFNEKTREFELKPVVNAWKRSATDKRMVSVFLGKKVSFSVTDGHRLLTTFGWKRAGDLAGGDQIIAKSDCRTGLLVPNPDQRQVVLGSELGDGYWRKDPQMKRGSRLGVRHGYKQIDYLRFKANILGATVKKDGVSGFTGTPQYTFNTKYISMDVMTIDQILGELDARGLAIWIMDDGSVIKSTAGFAGYKISTECFSYEDHLKFVDFFKTLGLTAIIHEYGKGDKRYLYLTFRKNDALKLRDMIAPYIPECMDYKIYGSATTEKYQWQSGFENYRLVTVDRLEEQASVKYVYDIEVGDNHNFIAKLGTNREAVGVVAHNCHNAASFLFDMFAVKLWQPEWKFDPDIDPTIENVQEIVKNALISLNQQYEIALANKVESQMEELESEIQKYGNVADVLKSFGKDVLIVKKKEEYKGRIAKAAKSTEQILIHVKPLRVSSIASDILWPDEATNKVILMSATIGVNDVKELGLSGRKCGYFESESPIPKERRPFIVLPVANMSYASQAESIPVIAKYLEVLATRHPNDKGLVHCTYGVAMQLQKLLKGNPRFLFHDKYTKNQRYLDFRNQKGNAILVASGMSEGIDLPDDCARWQVITKVQWPSLADDVNQYRAHNEPELYAWDTVRTIIQQSGRIVRGPTDYGATYLLDSGFRKLWNSHSRMFPEWFKAAMVWVGS